MVLPETEFPSIKRNGLKEIWQQSPLFNRFRGDDWMKQPCAGCESKGEDFGGCRCQAYLFTGDAANTDPVCHKSPQRGRVDEAIAEGGEQHSWQYRNPQNSRGLIQPIIASSKHSK